MSTTMRELEKALGTDAVKAEKFQEALKGAAEAGAKNDVEAFRLAAAAVDFDLTLEEAEKHLASSQEISDDDLEVVSGGTDYANCFVDYACTVTFMHGGDRNESCLADYYCDFLTNHYIVRPNFE